MYFWLNAAILPGLGSIRAGQKFGWLQLALTLGGALTAIISIMNTILALMDSHQQGNPDYSTVLLGLAVFGAAWVWSIISGLLLVKNSVSTPPKVF